MSDRVVIRHDGMTQWYCQMVGNVPDSNIDRRVISTGPSLDLASIRKEDLSQREPAGETNGYSPTGISRAEGTDTDEGTIACVMDDDRGQVILPGVEG